MEFQYQPGLGYAESSYIEYEDKPYAGSRYCPLGPHHVKLTDSTGEPQIDPTLLDDQEESEPARRKRQKFNRSRTACHPVCPT
jgi:hypothetical protein